MKVYILITEDRHVDTTAQVFVDIGTASWAASLALAPEFNQFSHEHGQVSALDVHEAGFGAQRDFGVGGLAGLSESMGDWVWWAQSREEGPCCWVVEQELDWAELSGDDS